MAQERPVTAAYTMEAGWSRLANTYLSPVHYNGWYLGLDYRRYQAMGFAPREWVMELAGNASASRGQNPTKSGTMWDFTLNVSWSMMRKFHIMPSLSLGVGPGVGLDAGALYNPRNGNNPAAAKGALTINAAAYAMYETRLGRVPVTLTYRPTLPVAGAFFSPDYGELYYEIYLGDHSGLCHAAWPGNRFVLDNLVTADLKFGATWLRVGYHGRIFSSKVNDIVSNSFTHAIVLGVSGEWLSINPRRKADYDNVITAFE